MNKNIIYSLAATFITAAVTLGSFTACSNEDMVADTLTTTQAPTYTVCIPASMGEDAETRAVEFGNDGSSITSKFKAGDKVYVYNETQEAFACESNGTPIPLTLTDGDISNGGKNCTLSGNLTFYKDNGSNPYSTTWTAVTPGENDTYTLFYNMSYVYCDRPKNSSYAYFDQNGSASDASDCDFAMKSGVTMTTSGSTLEPSATVSFESLQSMFRQHLSFTQGPNSEGSTSPTIKKLTVSTKNGTLATSYSPLRQIGVYNPSKYDCYYFEINNPQITGDGDIYLSMAFDYREGQVAAGDEMQLEAIDTEGNVYVTSKAIPTGGFTTGKYYYGSMTLAWSEQRYIKPTVTPAATPNEYGYYEFNGSGADLAYTISGSSKGYYFYIDYYSSCTLTLNNINAEYGTGSYIGAHANAGLNLVVNGANTVSCSGSQIAVGATYGVLKLSGNGTLTVTSNDADYCGLQGTNYTSSNNDHSTTTSVNVSTQLAADGYYVTRSAITDNGNGTYTWTYTVRPLINLSSLTGDYVAQDGDILTGTLASNLKLKIAAGATVTLAGMTHHAGASINSIECLGTANIILAEGTTNDLTRGSSDAFAGLFLKNGSDWSTLTISGTGTLLASGGNACAGIGGIEYCNDIVINGGTIYATGGQFAPGIGAGADSGKTGNITINGGDITATGGEGAAGIGAGTNSSYCYDITIANTVTSVTAIKGAGAGESIGHGSGVSSCGTVKFGDQTMYNGSQWKTTPTNGENYDGLHFVISTTTNTNDTWTLTPLIHVQGQGGLQNYNINPATEQ